MKISKFNMLKDGCSEWGNLLISKYWWFAILVAPIYPFCMLLEMIEGREK